MSYDQIETELWCKFKCKHRGHRKIPKWTTEYSLQAQRTISRPLVLIEIRQISCVQNREWKEKSARERATLLHSYRGGLVKAFSDWKDCLPCIMSNPSLYLTERKKKTFLQKFEPGKLYVLWRTNILPGCILPFSLRSSHRVGELLSNIQYATRLLPIKQEKLITIFV